MKRMLLTSLFFAFAITTCFCQNSLKEQKIVSVLKQQTIFLNGGMRSSFGGKSRTTIEIKLPPNTIEWYYTITTFDGATTGSTLDLVPQLTRALDPTGITSIAISAILAPTGSKSCDVHLMDWANAEAFLNKVDNNGGSFSSYLSARRENFRSGVIQIKDVTSGTYHLGFKNPSETQGIGIAVEVAAIVEEISEDAEKAVTYGNMGWKAFEVGDVDRCIELSKKALLLYSSLGYVKANLGLCYLIKNDETTATDYYVNALTDFKKIQNKSTARAYIKATLDDINNTLLKYPNLKGHQYIKETLINELEQADLSQK